MQASKRKLSMQEHNLNPAILSLRDGLKDSSGLNSNQKKASPVISHLFNLIIIIVVDIQRAMANSEVES
jgi:hypothetical protein